MKIKIGRLKHKKKQIKVLHEQIENDLNRVKTKNEILCNLLKAITEHLGPAFTDTIKDILEIRTDSREDMLTCYTNTLQNLENICIRLEHRLLEYTSPYLDDYLGKMDDTLNTGNKNRDTPRFQKRSENMEVQSNYLSRGTLEQVSTEREVKRSEIEQLIGILYRIIEC